MSQPPNKPNPYHAPVQQPPGMQPSATQQGDSTGGVIPYKNPKALIAYYMGILGMLPCLFPLGIAALVLGIMGLRDRKRNPVIKGSVHAWIGIVLGGGSALLWGTLLIVMIVTSFVG